MIGVRRRINNHSGTPGCISEMFDVDDIQIGHSMMIGAKGNQVVKRICAALCKGRDVVYMHMVIEPADNALVVIPQHGLLFNKLPFAALPVPIHVRKLWVGIGKALSIAIVTFLHLAREFLNFPAAIVTGNSNFISAAGRCRHALPFKIASPIPASYPVNAGVFLKRLTTNRAGDSFLAAPVIAVVLSSVLMVLDISVLSTWGLALWNNFTATARAINGLFGVDMIGVHKSIIHAQNS